LDSPKLSCESEDFNGLENAGNPVRHCRNVPSEGLKIYIYGKELNCISGKKNLRDTIAIRVDPSMVR